MKVLLSKSEWEKLTPAVQELYEAQDDGSYKLPIEGDGREDVGPLKRALDRVKAELDKEKAARASAEAQLEEIDTVDAKKRGDIDTLTAQWDKKLAEQQSTFAAREKALQEYISTNAIDAVVNSITSRNTASKENALLLDPHVRGKLSIQFGDDGMPQMMMAGEMGPVPFDAEVFEKSVVDNKAYSAIIVENRASGGGASDDNPGQGGGAFPTDTTRQHQQGDVDLSTMDPAELAAMLPRHQ